MLDDLKYIHERDAQDALVIAERQWQQLNQAFAVPKLTFTPENVVCAGMGGSALSASLSAVWPGYAMPFEVVRNYDIPKYVSEKTLFIASSYSGNTEEALSALEQAEKSGAQIVVMASGGKLLEQAKAKNYPLALIPGSMQPRHAFLYLFKALLDILNSSSILEANVMQEVSAGATFLQKSVASWRADNPTSTNQAKQIAHELIGKSIVVYGGPLFSPVAYKWKINFNENAKHIAWMNQYPEFNHNEFLGWTKQPTEKPYAVIELRSNLEHPRVQKRFMITEKLLSGLRPSPIVIEPQGDSLLQQLLWTIALGDFVSLYLALLNNINPTPVDLIEKFKIAMAN